MHTHVHTLDHIIPVLTQLPNYSALIIIVAHSCNTLTLSDVDRTPYTVQDC